MKIEGLNPYYSEVFDFLASKKKEAGLWRRERDMALTYRETDFSDTDAMLQALHELQRLNKIYIGELEDNKDFRTALKAEQPPLWEDFTAPPADNALQHSLAEKVYNIRPGEKDTGFISLGSATKEVGKWLIEKCMEDNAPFVIQFSDPTFDALVLNHATDSNVKKLAESFLAMTDHANRRMAAASGMPEKDPVKPDTAKEKLYQSILKPYGQRVRSGDMFFTLTIIPTRKDAEIDGIPYEEYTKLFFEMCDQPWDHITQAQAILIKELNAGKTLRMTNADGTDVSMNISGFTFCNSVIAKNVPGSEVFSAPQRESVNGKVIAKGRFIHDREIIEDLTMEFENGQLVRWHAESGQEAFEKAINLDDGARWIGEIGIGTNPHLKRHVANGLLVEKIGGSFHLALGAAYTLTEYGGIPVKVNNGNTSALHWDITTMLHGKEGCIYLDDRKIMDNGKWIDPAYDVLNRGWAAVPSAERPAYWQDYFENNQP